MKTLNILTATALSTLSQVAFAAESTTVVSLIWAFQFEDDLYASVVKANADATTYQINCPGGASDEPCKPSKGQTLIQGPSTYAMSFHNTDPSATGGIANIIDCKLTSSVDEALCSGTMIAAFEGERSTQITTDSLDGFIGVQMPVTVTGGLEKLDATPGASTTGASATSGATRASGTGTSSEPENTGGSDSDSATTASGSGTVTSSAPAETQTDNAAGSRGWNAALAGAAIAVGGIMAL